MNKEVLWAGELLAWFDGNKRELPWRENKDPYRIWVSEIMLQQTKVEAVKPYFYSWMEKFPTVEALAAAPEEEVLKAWQGLGYYQRAKNLHQAVQEVCVQYGGAIPAEKKAFQSLKGVGEYTAGAVTSIAFGKPEPAVDGNVLRIFARLYAIRSDILQARTKKAITALVQQQLPLDRPGDFNEALMDLGAGICIPKAPRCENCPLDFCCESRRLGLETELPVRKKKGEVPVYHITAVILENDGMYLLHRRPDTGLLASMWEFPAVRTDTKEEGKEALKELLNEAGVSVRFSDSAPLALSHVFSHQKWLMQAFFGHTDRRDVLDETGSWRWLSREEFTSVPWAGPHGKLAGKVR